MSLFGPTQRRPKPSEEDRAARVVNDYIRIYGPIHGVDELKDAIARAIVDASLRANANQ